MALRPASVGIAALLLAFGATVGGAQMPSGGFIVRDGPEGCSPAWIALDRDEDGSISRRDVLLTIQSEFGNIPTDALNAVTPETWSSCEGNPIFAGVLPPTRTPPTGVPLDPWAADADFAVSDANGDGMVSRDEAIAAETARYDAAGTSWPEWDIARSSGRRFLMYDRDSDGQLSAEEWAGRASATIDFRFERFDFDHSGTIDLEEWTQEARKVMLISANPDGSIDMWRFYYNF